ncbi:hypothetical protein P7K49_022349, partial [Saguinus oedipus]
SRSRPGMALSPGPSFLSPTPPPLSDPAHFQQGPLCSCSCPPNPVPSFHLVDSPSEPYR